MFDGAAVGRQLATEVKSILQPLRDRIAALEARATKLEAELEQRVYRGVWEAGVVYEKHNATTLAGSMWMCLQRTTARPGTDPQAWKLAVKKGNGRDA